MRHYSYIEIPVKTFNRALLKPLREAKFNRKMADLNTDLLDAQYLREGIQPDLMLIQGNYRIYSLVDRNDKPLVPDRVLVIRDNRDVRFLMVREVKEQ